MCVCVCMQEPSFEKLQVFVKKETDIQVPLKNNSTLREACSSNIVNHTSAVYERKERKQR